MSSRKKQHLHHSRAKKLPRSLHCMFEMKVRAITLSVEKSISAIVRGLMKMRRSFVVQTTKLYFSKIVLHHESTQHAVNSIMIICNGECFLHHQRDPTVWPLWHPFIADGSTMCMLASELEKTDLPHLFKGLSITALTDRSLLNISNWK